jgi:hypothetical protein
MYAVCKTSTPLSMGSWPEVTLRALCAALLVSLSACGRGDDGTPPSTSNPTPTVESAGIATSIDRVVSGSPVDLRVALSANGDGFVVWRTDEGTRHNLWASRYRATTGTWGEPISIEASDDDIDADFYLMVDAGGNAAVVWGKIPGGLWATRFETGSDAWTAPIELGGSAQGHFSAAGDASGAVHVVWNPGIGRSFDPITGIWRSEEWVAKTATGTGYTHGPEVALDGSGNALGLFRYGRTGVELLGSNYFTRNTGNWGQLPAGSADGTVIGEIPGSTVFYNGSGITNLQAVSLVGGNFLAAWQIPDGGSGALWDIRIAGFTSSTRTWSTAQTVVPGSAEVDLTFQRVGSGGGNTLLLWTQNDGTRTALKALRLDDAGIACGDVRTIDHILGGGAAQADLAVDPRGDAIVIWQQFEGGRANDGSRSNIAISRFVGTAGTWLPAMLAETGPGNASSPRASANSGQALLGWLQSEGGVNRVKVVLKSLADFPVP